MFEPKVHEAVSAILASYDELGGINHQKGTNLPSRDGVIAILRELEALIFPGFQENALSDCETLPFTTAQRVFGVLKDLTREIAKSLAFRERELGRTWDWADLEREAGEAAFALIQAIPEVRRQLQDDVQAFWQGDPAAKSTSEIILSYPGLEAILVHRLSHVLYKREIPLIPRMMNEYIHRKTGIDIHPGATLGRSLFIDHGTGVVIGETTIIGDYVKIFQGVTLGGLSVKKQLAGAKRHPTIEDHVTLYAGATILGGDTVVGHHSVVGGNVWLTHSVPSHSVIQNRPREHLIGQRDLDALDYQI